MLRLQEQNLFRPGHIPTTGAGVIALQRVCLSLAPPVLGCPWTQQRQYTLISTRISRTKPCSPGHSCYSSYWRLLRCSRKGLGDCLVTSPPLHSHTAGRVTARWVIPATRIRATREKPLSLFSKIYCMSSAFKTTHILPPTFPLWSLRSEWTFWD